MDLVNTIATFCEGNSIWVYLFIFFAKIIEVSLGTLRQVLINRGIRVWGSLIALIEMLIWLFVAGSILANYKSDPIKMIPYSLAYAMGNYFGSWLDERLAFGMCSIQAIFVNIDKANAAADDMRKAGFGISEINAMGINDEPRYMIVSTAKRKELRHAMELIDKDDPDAVITVSDIRTLRGGYLSPTPVRGFFVGHKK